MNLTARVQNDTIKLPPGIHLPDGTEVTIEVQPGILRHVKSRARKTRICIDRVTGLPVIKVSGKAQKLTSRQVIKLFAEFP